MNPKNAHSIYKMDREKFFKAISYPFFVMVVYMSVYATDSFYIQKPEAPVENKQKFRTRILESESTGQVNNEKLEMENFKNRGNRLVKI